MDNDMEINKSKKLNKIQYISINIINVKHNELNIFFFKRNLMIQNKYI